VIQRLSEEGKKKKKNNLENSQVAERAGISKIRRREIRECQHFRKESNKLNELLRLFLQLVISVLV